MSEPRIVYAPPLFANLGLVCLGKRAGDRRRRLCLLCMDHEASSRYAPPVGARGQARYEQPAAWCGRDRGTRRSWSGAHHCQELQEGRYRLGKRLRDRPRGTRGDELSRHPQGIQHHGDLFQRYGGRDQGLPGLGRRWRFGDPGVDQGASGHTGPAALQNQFRPTASGVIAVGHPQGFRFTTTTGIVSAVHATANFPTSIASRSSPRLTTSGSKPMPPSMAETAAARC